MNNFVTVIAGGAGFIGSNLLSSLVNENRIFFVFDNLSRGKKEYFLELNSVDNNKVHFINVDLSVMNDTLLAFSQASKYGLIDEVWHLAANSDIPAGVLNPSVDLRDTFMTTFSILEGVKRFQIKKLHFASSSAIYGDHGSNALNEDVGPLLPISNYGAMKLASEALISSAVESYLSHANIFRFPNVVGIPATHGVILDFVKKFTLSPSRLEVLGDGTQQKSYLHVQDLVKAMIFIRDSKNLSKIYPVNIGPIDDGVTVKFIAESVRNRINPNANISYGVGNKGWIGDVPKFNYKVDKILNLGWRPTFSSSEAISLAIDQIAKQEGF
jgi:UDP-glucose 4-epimerase